MFRILALVSVLTTFSLAHAQQPAPERFVCGSMGNQNSISLQYAGPRYGDHVYLELNEADSARLMLPRDQGKGIGYTHLGGFLQMGSCQMGSDPVLVTCKLREKDWGFVDWSFSHGEEIAKDVHQHVNVTRRMGLKELDIVVTRVDRKAHLKLKAVIDDGIERNRVLEIDRPLATIDHDWYKCRFE